MRSFSGCWTCRLRRKKCDERVPKCETCASLNITCHYDVDKPDWMDGGDRQAEMAARLKREIKEKIRRGPGTSHTASTRSSTVTSSDQMESPRAALQANANIADSRSVTSIPPRTDSSVQLDTSAFLSDSTPDWPDGCLFMFYIDNLQPFLFPFYSPSLAEGGKAWILEMMLASPVVRQTAVCQSSYFMSLALGVRDCSVAWNNVMMQTGEAFVALRKSLQVVQEQGIDINLYDAIKIMAGIIQLQSFDVAVSSFENCEAHLRAALAMLKQVLNSSSTGGQVLDARLAFNLVLDRLGPRRQVLPVQCVQLPSAEQASFRFATAITLLDDIIASAALQQKPQLFRYHSDLLRSQDGYKPIIDFESIIGCQNWALLHIGEIAALDAWKQESIRASSLDAVELIRRATVIKNSLLEDLAGFETRFNDISAPQSGSKGMTIVPWLQQTPQYSSEKPIVTQIWAHAAIVYLSVVVSGWQPSNAEVRFHVNHTIAMLVRDLTPPALLRTVVWPFCLVGCLADPSQRPGLQRLVERLQPPEMYGTVRKALEIMQKVWQRHEVGDNSLRDFSSCLRSGGSLVMLV